MSLAAEDPANFGLSIVFEHDWEGQGQPEQHAAKDEPDPADGKEKGDAAHLFA
jgi:hypothetical protein